MLSLMPVKDRINVFKNEYLHLPLQAKASIWFLFCLVLQKGISAISTPIFTRLMTPYEYGQYGVFNSWLGIVSIIVSLSLTSGIHMQGLVKFDKERNFFSSSLQSLLTILVLAWTGIYLLFQNFWNNIFSLSSLQILSMLIMIWATSIFNFWANEQKVDYKYRALVILTLLVSLADPLFGIYLVTTSKDKVTARILGVMVVELIGYSWLYFKQIKYSKVVFSKRFWSYALCLGLPLLPHYLSQVMLNNSDRIMIKSMVGATETGIYDLAYSVSLIMIIFNIALLQTISPWLYQRIKNKCTQDIAPIAYMTLIFIAIVNLFLMIFAPEIISVFAPQAYYEAIWVVPPVSMSVFFMYCYDLFAKFAFYYEKIKFIVIASIIAAVSNIALNYIFIDLYGYIAAGYTTLFCFIIYAIGHYIFMKRVCDQFCNSEYPYETNKLLIISCIFLVAGFTVLSTYNYPLIRYGIIVAIGIILMYFRILIVDKIKMLIKVRIR